MELQLVYAAKIMPSIEVVGKEGALVVDGGEVVGEGPMLEKRVASHWERTLMSDDAMAR
jgi:hypothetical protein